jgi:hypothetical protein
MSRDKPGTSDATDADINERKVLRQQSRKIFYNVYMFLKKLSSDDKHANTDFWKTQEQTVQACGSFIPDSKWIFSSRPHMRDSDYHLEINAYSFKV